MNLSSIAPHIERISGLTMSEIKSYSPSELKTHIEKRKGTTFRFVSEFPVIGRGNVLRSGISSTSDINKDVDKILGLS